MARRLTLRAVTNVAIVALLVACSTLLDRAAGPQPSESFLAWLAAFARQFTPATAPAGSAAPDAPVSSGGTAWAAVDPETGDLTIGDGP